jgi:hypothetical protein
MRDSSFKSLDSALLSISFTIERMSLSMRISFRILLSMRTHRSTLPDASFARP